MRRPPRRDTGPVMGDRFWFAVGCAAIGAFWGAVVSVAWMFLGHPFSPGPVVVLAGSCALLGLFIGESFVDLLAAPLYLAYGVLLGWTDAAHVLPPPDDDSPHVPRWLKLVFWGGVLIGVLLWLEVL